MKSFFLFTLLCFVVSFSLSGQSVYYNHGHDNFLRLEFNRPVFSDDFGSAINFLSFDSYLNGEFTVGGKNKLAFELPYNRLSFDLGNSRSSDSQFGNIALAYQIRNLDDANYFEFKVRLPTAQETSFGGFGLLFTDYTERFTSVIPDIFSLEVSLNKESTNTQGAYYRFNPGLNILIPTSDDAFDDPLEMLLDINILGGYRNQNIDFNAGLTTTSIITESDIDFSDRILRQLFTTFTYTGTAFKPGVIIRLPFGDTVGDSYDVVLGVHFSYVFGGSSKKTTEDKPAY